MRPTDWNRHSKFKPLEMPHEITARKRWNKWKQSKANMMSHWEKERENQRRTLFPWYVDSVDNHINFTPSHVCIYCELTLNSMNDNKYNHIVHYHQCSSLCLHTSHRTYINKIKYVFEPERERWKIEFNKAVKQNVIIARLKSLHVLIWLLLLLFHETACFGSHKLYVHIARNIREMELLRRIMSSL